MTLLALAALKGTSSQRSLTHTHTQTEQPVFRAPHDHSFDSQGEEIVIEQTSDTCVGMSLGGGYWTHTSHSKVNCHHNGLMSEELQGKDSGAGYTYCSVGASPEEREKGEKRARKRGECTAQDMGD